MAEKVSIRIGKEEVKHIANLARIKFTEEELEKFTEEFKKIVEYMNKIREVSEEIEIKFPEKETKLREDKPVNFGKIRLPHQKGEFFKSPKIWET